MGCKMTESMLLSIEQTGNHLLGMAKEYEGDGKGKYGTRKDIIFGLREFAWKLGVVANVLENQLNKEELK